METIKDYHEYSIQDLKAPKVTRWNIKGEVMELLKNEVAFYKEKYKGNIYQII